jgi:preprotein translocase subunit SecF
LVKLETVFVLFIIEILFVCRGGQLWVIKFTGGYSVTTDRLGVSGVSVCKCWV